MVRKSKRRSTGSKRSSKKRSTAIMQPKPLTAAGRAFFGGNQIARTQAMKKIWTYIKSKNLQDKSDGRIVHMDAKLNALLSPGVSKIHMTKIPGLLGKAFA